MTQTYRWEGMPLQHRNWVMDMLRACYGCAGNVLRTCYGRAIRMRYADVLCGRTCNPNVLRLCSGRATCRPGCVITTGCATDVPRMAP